MKLPVAMLVVSVCAATSLACGSGDTISGPSSTPTQTTIAFTGLSDPACIGLAPTAPQCGVRSYLESEFKVSVLSGEWVVRSNYGHPAPFIQFIAPAGATATAGIRVTTDKGRFRFTSVDLYASTVPIPYTITGLRDGADAFTFSNTVPNTFGDFITVTNPNSSEAIDELSIRLTNAAAPCCRNPTGLDTLVLSR